MAAMPKKEYATTEAKCRALRAARTEALDRLDEMISCSENGSMSQEWSHDIKAGEEIIVPLLNIPCLPNISCFLVSVVSRVLYSFCSGGDLF
jgi:hypothetical protein